MIEDTIREIVRTELARERAEERQRENDARQKAQLSTYRILLQDGSGKTVIDWPVSSERSGIYTATSGGHISGGGPVARIAKIGAGTI